MLVTSHVREWIPQFRCSNVKKTYIIFVLKSAHGDL